MKEQQRALGQHELSRRAFHKVLWTAAGALAVSSVGLGIAVEGIRQKRFPASLSSIERFPHELRLYGADGIAYIDRIEKSMNMLVPLPGTVALDERCVLPQEEQLMLERYNYPWKLEELELLARRAVTLPYGWRTESKTLLTVFRTDASPFSACTLWGRAEQSKKHILIYAPEGHKPALPFIWDTWQGEVDGIFVHELSHRTVTNKPDILTRYTEKFDWHRTVDGWSTGRDDLGVLDWIYQFNRIHGPSEALAFHASLYVTRPDLIGVPQSEVSIFLQENLFEGKMYPGIAA